MRKVLVAIDKKRTWETNGGVIEWEHLTWERMVMETKVSTVEMKEW